jgi:SAM-dependent methyltransferase
MLAKLARAPRSLVVRWSKAMSRKNLYRYLLEGLERVPDGSTLLSVGAGGGVNEQLAELASRKRLTIVSSDIDPERGPDIVDDITASTLEDGSFDAVLIAEVLEHVTAPWLAAAELRRITKPGGLVIGAAPFIYPVHDRPHDYFRFTHYGLKQLFRDYAALEIRPRNAWGEAVLSLWCRIATEPGGRALAAAWISLPFTLLAWPLLAGLSKLAPSDFATTDYVFVARA